VNPHEHIRLWHDDTGKLVGYAILGEDPSFDCQLRRLKARGMSRVCVSTGAANTPARRLYESIG
jgi:hypothetical protein